MKTYKQFVEEQGVTSEKETINEILPLIPAVVGGLVKGVALAAKVATKAVGTGVKLAAKGAAKGVKVAAKGAVKGAAKGVKVAAKGAAKGAAAASKNISKDQAQAYKDKQKPQAKKDRDAMGRHESVKEDWLDKELEKVQHQWNEKGSDGKMLWDRRRKMNWIDKMDVKAGRYDLSDYELDSAMNDYGISHNLKDYNPDGSYTTAGSKKMFGSSKPKQKMTPTFKGKPIKPKTGRQTVRTESVEAMAHEMNSYVKTLSIARHKNIWAEAAKKGEDPEPVKGKKTMTGEKQSDVKINPKEAMPKHSKIGVLG